MELIYWASGIYVRGLTLLFGTLLAPTLVEGTLKREGVFWILAVNVVPSLVGLRIESWVFAMAWPWSPTK